MPPKKKPVKVPKPVLKGNNEVNCWRCGTLANYTIEDMLNHREWCNLAKKQQEAAAAAKAKRKKGAHKNH